MSVLSQVVGAPGMRAAKTAVHRAITYGGWIPDILPLGRTISGAVSRDPGNTPDLTRLRAGLLMGKITTQVNGLGTVGYYGPSVYGPTTGALAAGATTVTADAAVVTELLRRRGATGTFNLVGPGSAGGPVVTELVTYSAGSSTNITVTAIANNFITGALIMPTDGTQDILAFLPSGTPLMATDFDGNNADVPWPDVPVQAIVKSTQLLPVWPTDASLQEWIVSRLNRAAGGKFIFDHTY